MTNIKKLNIFKDLDKDILDQMNFRDLCELGEKFYFEGSYDADTYAGKQIDGNPEESEIKAEIVSNYLDDNYSIRGTDYLHNNHSDGFEDAQHPLLDNKCDKCSNPTKGFTLNLCENCFDEETDRYYDEASIDEEPSICEKCEKETEFSLNCCEDCFDKAIDKYYDGGYIDEEDEE